MGYDKKYKERVLSYLATGHTQAETAAVFGVGTTTIKEWKKRQASGEGLQARTRRSTYRKIDPERLRAYVSANPDAYEREIAAEFGCVRSAVQKALKRVGITRKKRR
jgi:transposase